MRVEAGGSGVAGHVGLHLVGSFADRLGLGDALSSAVLWRGPGRPGHDRGKVLVQTALMLSAGGESCSDIEYLRSGTGLFGRVPSDTTVARMFSEISVDDRERIAAVVAVLREKVWTQTNTGDSDSPVLLDIDASLVDVHSENKEQAAATFKGGYGFHPMFCFADATGETLAGVLRAGNAGSNTVADHVTVLDEAVGQLPAGVAAGHQPGAAAGDVLKEVVVRADSAGCTAGFLAACRERNIGFYVTARSNSQVSAAVFDAEGVEGVWKPALDTKGESRTDGAVVAELTSLIDDPKLPAGTRLIVRREPLHPGAQTSLLPSYDHRYWGFYTDQPGEPEDVDVVMRGHARVEQHIARLKDSGLCRFPFTNFETNQAWMATVMLAADLLRWFQLCCLPDSWKQKKPKTLRWAILNTPGRLIRSGRRTIIRIADTWPTLDVIIHAHQKIGHTT